MIIKLLPILSPFLIFIIIRLVKSHFPSTLFSKKTNKTSEMIACYSCGTFIHEDLLYKKFGRSYCSRHCSNQ